VPKGRPLVYLGGMAAVRSLCAPAWALCASGVALLVWSIAVRAMYNIAFFAVLCAGMIAFIVVTCLRSLHAVYIREDRWILVPVWGKSKPRGPALEVYESADDVIAIGLDGHVTVLGVGRFPFRNRAALRRSLAGALREAGGGFLRRYPRPPSRLRAAAVAEGSP